MKYADFSLGTMFFCADRLWRCTDIGTRVIVAMRIDAVEVGSNTPNQRRSLNRAQAEAEG